MLTSQQTRAIGGSGMALIGTTLVTVLGLRGQVDTLVSQALQPLDIAVLVDLAELLPLVLAGFQDTQEVEFLGLVALAEVVFLDTLEAVFLAGQVLAGNLGIQVQAFRASLDFLDRELEVILGIAALG